MLCKLCANIWSESFIIIVCYSASKVLAWVQVLYLSDREKAFVKTKFGPVFSVSTMCVRRN